MHYYLDEEFIDTGSTIDLISIGIVAEDGRELYLQSSQFNWEAASDWVRENVYPHLRYCSLRQQTDGGIGTIQLSKVYHQGITGVGYDGKCTFSDCPWRTREQIKSEILAFMDIEKYDYPELIGWCSAYDFVAFCQLFGTMMDVPRFIPHYMKDVQYLLDEYGLNDDMLPKQEGTAHNALQDAKYIRQLWESLLRYDAEMRQ